MARLSEEKISEIRKLYKEIKTYSGVAKAIGCSPSTVKKYCQEEKNIPQREKTPFDKEIKNIEDIYWPDNQEELSNFAILSKDEMEEIFKLWEEIEE